MDEKRTPEEEKKIKLINQNLDSNINGVTENHALALELNSFFFSERPEPVGLNAAKGQTEETPIGWLDAVIEKLRYINRKNAGICLELRKLHKETT